MLRFLSFFSLLLAASPAAADVTGHYRNGEERLTVEVSDAGLIRLGPDGGANYTVFDGEEGYVVSNEPGGTVVMRWSDMIAALDAVMAEMLGSVPDAQAGAPQGESQWQAAGPATIEGRPGVEYRLPSETLPDGQAMVLSDDVRLAPLGRAWSRAFASIPNFGGMFGPAATPAVRELGVLLAGHAPLQLGAIRLVDVSFDTVEPSRFTLPSAPLSREQVAERLRPRLSTPEPESAH